MIGCGPAGLAAAVGSNAVASTGSCARAEEAPDEFEVAKAPTTSWTARPALDRRRRGHGRHPRAGRVQRRIFPRRIYPDGHLPDEPVSRGGRRRRSGSRASLLAALAERALDADLRFGVSVGGLAAGDGAVDIACGATTLGRHVVARTKRSR